MDGSEQNGPSFPEYEGLTNSKYQKIAVTWGKKNIPKWELRVSANVSQDKNLINRVKNLDNRCRNVFLGQQMPPNHEPDMITEFDGKKEPIVTVTLTRFDDGKYTVKVSYGCAPGDEYFSVDQINLIRQEVTKDLYRM